MTAITVVKLQINTFNKKEWGGCKNSREFNTVLFKYYCN